MIRQIGLPLFVNLRLSVLFILYAKANVLLIECEGDGISRLPPDFQRISICLLDDAVRLCCRYGQNFPITPPFESLYPCKILPQGMVLFP